MHRLLKLLLVAVCLFVSLYQMVVLLELYFRYPFSVSISVPTRAFLPLPALTLCTSAFSNRQKVLSACRESERMTGAPDLNECLTDYLAKTPLHQVLNDSMDMRDFVPDIRCAAAESDDNLSCNQNLSRASVLQSFQGNLICWTLFHSSTADLHAILSGVKVPSGYMQSALLLADAGVSLSTFNQSIQPREVVRFLFNFTTGDAITVTEDKEVYGTIGVHDPRIVRQSRRGNSVIHSGRFYLLNMEEQETISLPPPYQSMCYDYRKNEQSYWSVIGSGSESHRPHPLTPFPLSSTDCFAGCMAVKAVEQADCLCWPPEIPFMRSDQDFQPMVEDDSFLCNWISSAKASPQFLAADPGSMSPDARNKLLMLQALNQFRNCSAMFERECRKACPKGCLTRKILVAMTDMEWPSKEEINGADTELLKQQLNTFKNCCTILSVRWASTTVTVYTAQAKYELIEFISYIGGIVSLWMGFTFVGIFDYARQVFLHLRRFNRWLASHGLRLRKHHRNRKRISNGIPSRHLITSEKRQRNHKHKQDRDGRLARDQLPWYVIVDPVDGSKERQAIHDYYNRYRRMSVLPPPHSPPAYFS